MSRLWAASPMTADQPDHRPDSGAKLAEMLGKVRRRSRIIADVADEMAQQERWQARREQDGER